MKLISRITTRTDEGKAPRPTAIVLVLFVLLAPGLAGDVARAQHSAELLLGGPLNAPASLSIEQDGENSIELDAEYETRPFEFPLYYAWRIARDEGNGRWELQFIHHKLYLENKTDEVQRFEITHGLNIVTLNRSFQVGPLEGRLGVGTVLAHADSRIRGRTPGDRGILDSGYEIAGPAIVAGAGKRMALSESITGLLEAQVSLARAVVTVAGGRAETGNVALHLFLGVGYDW
jgi:hypothetical protein